MSFNPSWFGEKPELHRLMEAEREHLEHAKDVVLDAAQLAVVGPDGKRLSERKWREHMNFIGSL